MTKIALVCPYSWSYPGGVSRHIEALAEHFLAGGHDVRVFAPNDPDDRLAGWLHRGARPQRRALPDYVVPLGRTVGFPANGAVSNLSLAPHAFFTLRQELRTGGFDVVHVHEPNVPVLAWDTIASARLPLVGTFHAYSRSRIVCGATANVLGARRLYNKLHVRIAVSHAAAWTARRFYGGRYRLIPNGVDVAAIAGAPSPPSDDALRIVFVGQALERKGLPVLLSAFEALRDHVPATLTVVGASSEEIAPMLLDDRGVTALGKVSDAEKHARLREADVLCAPSLGGESFGMVLTEAFAAATPVVASDIAGYRDVVRDGVDGLLVPRGDATELAEALRDLWHAPERRTAMSAAAAESAQRFAWPHVAAEVLDAYADAAAVEEPQGAVARALVRTGIRPADGLPAEPPRALPSLEPDDRNPLQTLAKAARRVGLAAGALGAAALATLALQRIGLHRIATSLIGSSPSWVLAALALMCLAMLMRALSWHQILRAALPDARVRLTDAIQGTMIGVLMSATLPARLGEPSRALIVARRIGRARESLPVVLGTLVSQTLLNLVALTILGVVMFSSVGLFAGHQGALVAATLIPVALLALVLVAPAVLRRGRPSRFVRVQSALAQARNALARVRRGLAVFRRPRAGGLATIAQLAAWGLQWIACYVLLVALGLDHRAGIGAAAAVLFAVNVTAVLPPTPSNVGVFQAACVAVLTGAYGISSADALGYGIILQAVEIATALILGGPALVKEGLSWRDVRLRTVHAAPVRLGARGAARDRAASAKAET